MGVPAFFRWLSRKYPSVVANCVEITSVDEHGRPIPVDATQPNPNGVEFDNLYLDMNGIIHPCTHPEDRPPPKTEDEMMIAIFECIDRILNIVRPRKLLYMAVDGVAPRAKMNQQRSRRFRASKETAEKMQEIARIREKLEAKGALLPPVKESGSHFDSNCITPGTPFMARLSKCLHYYAHDRLNNHPAWKNIKVILSDANVPGEGEHKIMDFIRKQRSQPDHDPNTKHCLCGADADLIMLGLATHEPHFTIIREEFRPNADKPCDVCGKLGHEMKDCSGLDSIDEEPPKFATEVQFIFVRLNVLKEYLKRELEMPGLPFEYDFERVLDDWVFMCFFVGNDFLPHLPSLEIREGAIDRLIGLYKKCVYRTNGFLTENGNVNLNRVQLIMSDLGVMEDEIFKKRHQTELSFRARDKMRKKQMKRVKRESNPSRVLGGQYAPVALGSSVTAIVNPRMEIYSQRVQSMHTSINQNGGQNNNSLKRKHEGDDEDSDEEEEEVHDEVRLYEAGFKDRYYESKFDVDADNIEFRYKVGFEYVRGLCWVLHYYYQGCPSWKWYFPYHYAPFASDFVNIAASPIVFEKGTKPFKPLEQLMGVFPAASKSHVPEPWSTLMYDADSPIIDFYPEDFKIDLNGKKFAWQGVALIPFPEEDRLFKALEPLYHLLTDYEKERNMLGDERLYIPESNKKYKYFMELCNNVVDFEMESAVVVDNIACTVLLAHDNVEHGGILRAPVNGLETIKNNTVLCLRYRDVKYGENHIYPATRLPEAKDPPPVLKPQDLSREASASYRPMIGMARSTQIARIDLPGHRMLNFHASYTSIPPPANYSRESRPYNSFSGRGAGGRDGDSRSNQQYGQNYNQSNYQQPYARNSSGHYDSVNNANRNSNNGSPYQRRTGGYEAPLRQPSLFRSRGGYAAQQYRSAENSYRQTDNRSHDGNRNQYQSRYQPNSPASNIRPPGNVGSYNQRNYSRFDR